MKFLLPILSFLLGNAKNFFEKPREALSQQLVLRLRALVAILISCIGSLVLFCVGASLLANHIAVLLDSPSGFSWTTGVCVYTGWSVLTFVILLISLRRGTWLKAMGFGTTPEAAASKKTGPLENAVALLVMDFLEERQRRRRDEA